MECKNPTTQHESMCPVGVDMAEATHYACAVTASGEHVLARPVPNDETAMLQHSGWLSA